MPRCRGPVDPVTAAKIHEWKMTLRNVKGVAEKVKLVDEALSSHPEHEVHLILEGKGKRWLMLGDLHTAECLVQTLHIDPPDFQCPGDDEGGEGADAGADVAQEDDEVSSTSIPHTAQQHLTTDRQPQTDNGNDNNDNN